MTASTLGRLAAVAWLLSAAERVALIVVGGSDRPGASNEALALGAVLGVVVGVGLLRRPGPGSALVAALLGSYAVTALPLVAIIGIEPWLVVLVATGLAAFALSVAAAIASRRVGRRPQHEPER